MEITLTFRISTELLSKCSERYFEVHGKPLGIEAVQQKTLFFDADNLYLSAKENGSELEFIDGFVIGMENGFRLAELSNDGQPPVQ